MDELKRELKQLIITSCALQDLTHDQILDDQPLFQEGLGLDSIDALELATAIEKRYGVRFTSDDSENERIFGSLRSLCQHIEAQRRGGALRA